MSILLCSCGSCCALEHHCGLGALQNTFIIIIIIEWMEIEIIHYSESQTTKYKQSYNTCWPSIFE